MHALTARAPARVDFGGGWTDVPPYSDERGGCVCCASIALHAVATVRSRSVSSAPGDDAEGMSLARAALRRRRAHDLDVVIESEYPVGAGLGGSSAASIAALAAIAAWQKEQPLPGALAEESRRLEVEDLGIPGGRQDHYAAAFGGFLGLRFGGTTTVTQLAISIDAMERLASRCVLVYTGVSRLSGDTITAVVDSYRARDRRVLGALDRLRELATGMIDSVMRENFDDLGALVGEHWVHQRTLHPAIPTPLIDQLLEVARRAGALGGKAMGASGGGCVLVIATDETVEAVRAAMSALATPLRLQFAPRGVHILAAGEAVAHPLRPWSAPT